MQCQIRRTGAQVNKTLLFFVYIAQNKLIIPQRIFLIRELCFRPKKAHQVLEQVYALRISSYLHRTLSVILVLVFILVYSYSFSLTNLPRRQRSNICFYHVRSFSNNISFIKLIRSRKVACFVQLLLCKVYFTKLR